MMLFSKVGKILSNKFADLRLAIQMCDTKFTLQTICIKLDGLIRMSHSRNDIHFPKVINKTLKKVLKKIF